MKTTCPKCRTSYDVPTAAVLAAARPIIAREAGRVRSAAKAAAARENGKKGGRPKNAGSNERDKTQSGIAETAINKPIATGGKNAQ